MKKIVCFVLCVLLLGALAAASFAAGSATITLTPSKMNPAHGEEVTFTYDDTKISDEDGFMYGYVFEDGMLKIDVGDGQIFHCQKK